MDMRPEADEVRWAVLPAAEAEERAGTRVARFGDRAVAWSERAAPPGARTGAVRSELSLVTQVGRAFQDEHPEVEIVLDHGRHLVVDGAAALREKDDTCWRVEPLPADTVVDRPAVTAGAPDPFVERLIAEVTGEPYEADVTWMASLPTRHSLSAGFREAAGRAAAALEAMGYATTRVPISVGGAGQSENVIAERSGTGTDRGVVVVTAHLDSVNSADGPSAAAPGADDNASGAAGLLTLARVLAGRTWRHDLRLILFGGEEQGLFGSRRHVAALSAEERSRIRAVLNMDMIASRNGPVPTVLLEGAEISRGLIDDLAAAAATYTGLRVETSLNPFASDHVPFLDAGIPALLTIEGDDRANGNVHTARDALTTLDLGYAVEILRMNAAALAGRLGAVH